VKWKRREKELRGLLFSQREPSPSKPKLKKSGWSKFQQYVRVMKSDRNRQAERDEGWIIKHPFFRSATSCIGRSDVVGFQKNFCKIIRYHPRSFHAIVLSPTFAELGKNVANAHPKPEPLLPTGSISLNILKQGRG